MSMFTCPYFKYIENKIGEETLLGLSDYYFSLSNVGRYPFRVEDIVSYAKLKEYSSFLIHNLSSIDFEEKIVKKYTLEFNKLCSKSVVQVRDMCIDGDYLTNGGIVLIAIKSFFDNIKWRKDNLAGQYSSYYNDTKQMFDNIYQECFVKDSIDDKTFDEIYVVLWNIMLLIASHTSDEKVPNLNYEFLDCYDDIASHFMDSIKSESFEFDTNISNLISLDDLSVKSGKKYSVEKSREYYSRDKNKLEKYDLFLTKYWYSNDPQGKREDFDSDDGITLIYETNMSKQEREEYFKKKREKGFSYLRTAEFIYTEKTLNRLFEKYINQRRWIYQNYLYCLLELTYIRWNYEKDKVN